MEAVYPTFAYARLPQNASHLPWKGFDLTTSCHGRHENVTEVRHNGKMLFRGHVRDLPLPALLSVLHEQGQSCDVTLTDGPSEGVLPAEGVLLVREGVPVHAEFAAREGVAAFVEACRRAELIYAVCPAAPAQASSIHASPARVIALGCQAADESQRLRAEQDAEAEYEASHGGRISRFQVERERTSRTLGHLALGVAVVLAAMVLLLRPTGHAADSAAQSIAAARR